MDMHLSKMFHTGYAVRDIDGATQALDRKLGIANWKIVRLPDDSPGNALGFARTGNSMIELIDTKPGQMPVYDGWAGEDPATLRIHHLGYFARDRAHFDAIASDFEAKGFPMVIDDEMPGILNFRYFDTVELLGHYTEFVLMQSGGEVFWADVPEN